MTVIDYATGEVIERAALVPVENLAAVEALGPQAREAAVTHMLSEARAWLAHAVESTSPQTIANFKAQMATVAEATKQLNLSKEIQLDAQEMVRRAERGVGQAIRKGQADGTVTSRGVRENYGGPGWSLTRSNPDLVSAGEILPTGEDRAQTYAVTDGVTDDQFDAAIDAAKGEGNLSRANVVRKVRDIKAGGPETRDQRARKIAELAASGHSTRQIAPLVGIGEQAVAHIIRDYGIDVPADQFTKNRRRIKSSEVVENVIATIEAAIFSLELINPSEVQGDQIDSLIQSTNALRKAVNKIKESS